MTKSPTRNRKQPKLLTSTGMVIAIALISVVLIGLLYMSSRPSGSGGTVQFRDIHGLGFSSDGSQLSVPAHDGLRIFMDGQWQVPNLPVNDYMGYSPTDNGFYSSGHPGPGSGLINPLGLVTSADGGQTINTLAFAGETDFHIMGVGYESHTVYVLNSAPNSQLSTGLYYTSNEGQTWEQSLMQGISTRPFQIAVHPTQASVIALATEGGLFLSNDSGNTFTQVSQNAPISSASFDPNGSRLIFGYQRLNLYNLDNGEINALQTPTITGDDAIGFIAVSPVSDEIAFATYNKDIYLSADNGLSWAQIAQQGIGES